MRPNYSRGKQVGQFKWKKSVEVADKAGKGQTSGRQGSCLTRLFCEDSVYTWNDAQASQE